MITPVIFAAPGDADPTFVPVVPDQAKIRDIIPQPDGKVLVHYWLHPATIGDTDESVLTRFHSDGTADETFTAGTDSPSVQCVELLPNGKVLAGGYFNSFNGTVRSLLVRLNPDGSIDENFDAHLEAGPEGGSVARVLPQSDGRFVIAGTFKFHGEDTIRHFVRLNADGSRDNSFEPPVSLTSLTDMEVQPDGKILVSGHMTSNASSAPVKMLRLNPNGSVDAGFTPPSDIIITSFTLQPDGKIVCASIRRLIRFEANGNLDSSFLNEDWTQAGIEAIALQPDGAIVAGANYVPLKRFLSDGVLDPTFNPAVNLSIVSEIVLDSAGRSLVGGATETTTGTMKAYLGRLIGGNAPATGAGEFTLAAPVYSIREASKSATVWVKRTGGNSLPATISYVVHANGGTAGDEDFTAASGTLSFAAGETFKAINVAITDDSLVEVDETVLVTLSNPTGGATLDAFNTFGIIIVDDEKPGQFGWRTATASVIEGQTQLTLEVSRGGDTSGAVSVEFQLVPGSASNGADYVLPNGPVAFADGQNVKTVVIQILNDALKEGGEDFALQLANPTGGAVVGSTSTVSVVIEDDDGPGALAPSFSVTPPPAEYYDPVHDVAELPDGRILVADGKWQSALRRLNSDGTLDASFAPPFPNGASVDQIIVQPDGGIILAGYYLRMVNGLPSCLVRLNADGSYDDTFNPDISLQLIHPGRLALQPDGNLIVLRGPKRLLPDGSLDERFNPSGAQLIMFDVAFQADGKILAKGKFALSGGDYVTGMYRLHPGGEFDPSFVWDSSIRVDSWEAGGTAIQPDGKILLAGNFITSDGNRRLLIRVLPTGKLDPSFEAEISPAWTFYIPTFVLLQPDGKIIVNGGPFDTATGPYGSVRRLNPDGSVDPTFGTLGFAPDKFGMLSSSGNLFFSARQTDGTTRLVKAVGGELDLPGGGKLGFGWAGYDVNEAMGRAVVHVIRKEGNSGTATVGYATVDGSAHDGRDYSSRSGTLTFGPGEIAKSIEIPLINTAAVDGSRQFGIALNNPSTAVLGTPASATVSIKDSESGGQFQFDAASYTVREGGTLTVKVTRILGADQQATVDYSATGQSASSGADYILASGTLTFEDGEVEKTLTVQVPLDGALEGNETFSLALANATGGGALGSLVSATVTIQDEDDGGSFKSFTLLRDDTTISAAAKLPDGKMMVAGRFIGGIVLVRVLPDGNIDGQFNSAVTYGTIRAIAVQADGKVVIVGSDLHTPGGASQSVMRLNADGTIDPSLNQFTGVVGESGSLLGDLRAVGVQSDGKIILGGSFVKVNGITRRNLARLLPDGSLDLTFQPEVGYQVLDLIVAKDDTILVPTLPNKLVRLKPDGTVDPQFQAQFSGSIFDDQLVPQCIALDSYDRILVGGYFTHANGQARQNLARLLPNGTLDTSFNSGALSTPDAIAIQEDGRILAGGYYLHADGGIVRLHEDGASDSTFRTQPVPSARWDHVTGLAVLERAGLLVFGGFQEIDGRDQKNCALLLLGKRPGAFRFAFGPVANFAEDVGIVAVTINRVGGSEGPATVDYATEADTAAEVTDFVRTAGTLAFEDGETSKTFDLILLDNTNYEPTEQFHVKLSNGTGSFLSAINRSLRVDVTDNEVRYPGIVLFAASSVTVNEEEGIATIRVDRVDGSDDVVSVNFATVAGTAQSGKDFVQRSGTITFEDGVFTQTIEIPILNGDLAEEPEQFSVVLSEPALGASLGTPSSISVTIEDVDTGNLNLFRGTYAGLLHSDGSAFDGLIQMTVGTRGIVSGYVLLGKRRYAFRGRMNAEGEIAIRIPRGILPPIELTFAVNVLDPATEQISGFLKDGDTVFEIAANRRTFETKGNPAAAAGHYTLILSPETGDGLPLGHGYAVVNITKGGAVRVTGKLADGGAFSSTSNLTKDNRWPLYVPLYAKAGLLSGAMELSHGDSWNCSGQADWFKPARARDKYYPEGFNGTVTMLGAAKPSSGFAIPSGSGVQANLFGGGLNAPLGPLALELLPNRTLRGSEGLKLSVNAATGIISGQFVHPLTQRAVSIRGVVVPNENRGAGFFLGPESGGAVELTITPSTAP